MRYKVLVVEDEPPILRNIVQKIEALELPVTVVATAMDGEEALVQIERHQPHIVFTDIRMSGMDGLALCGKLSETHPQIKTVVISGYGEFEYAQQAIQCRVSGYLLKPVNSEDLRKLVQQLCQTLRLENAQQQRQILVRRLTGTAEEGELPCQLAEETFGISLICLGNLLDHTTGDTGLPFFSALWKRADLASVLETLLPAQTQWWLIGEKHPNEQILITSAFLPDAGEALHRGLAAHLGDGVGVTVCGCPQAIVYQDLWKTAQLLRYTLRKALSPCVSRFFTLDCPPVFIEAPADALLALVLRGVHNRQAAQFSAALGQYFSALEAGGAPQRYLEQGVAAIIKAVGEHSGATPPPGLRDALYQLVAESPCAAALYAALRKKLEALFAASFPACISGEELARTVKKYLEENYQKEISIDTLTDTFHFSASYIGRVFRDQFGAPPVKYLLHLRMQRAKALLAEGVSVALAAQAVGYEDAHYFSRLFRATVGMSPSEYRAAAE